jgi:hypothetical protein
LDIFTFASPGLAGVTSARRTALGRLQSFVSLEIEPGEYPLGGQEPTLGKSRPRIALCQNCVLPPVIYWYLLAFTGTFESDKHHKRLINNILKLVIASENPRVGGSISPLDTIFRFHSHVPN